MSQVAKEFGDSSRSALLVGGLRGRRAYERIVFVSKSAVRHQMCVLFLIGYHARLGGTSFSSLTTKDAVDCKRVRCPSRSHGKDRPLYPRRRRDRRSVVSKVRSSKLSCVLGDFRSSLHSAPAALKEVSLVLLCNAAVLAHTRTCPKVSSPKVKEPEVQCEA